MVGGGGREGGGRRTGRDAEVVTTCVERRRGEEREEREKREDDLRGEERRFRLCATSYTLWLHSRDVANAIVRYEPNVVVKLDDVI